MHSTYDYERAYKQICHMIGTKDLVVSKLGIIYTSPYTKWLGHRNSGIYLMQADSFDQLDAKKQHQAIVDTLCERLKHDDIYGYFNFEKAILIPRWTTFDELVVKYDLEASMNNA